MPKLWKNNTPEKLKSKWRGKKITLPLSKNLSTTLARGKVGFLWKKKF